MNNINILRQEKTISIYIMHFVDVGYHSILVVSPRDTAFLWMTNRHMNYADSIYFHCKMESNGTLDLRSQYQWNEGFRNTWLPGGSGDDRFRME